MKNKIVYIAHPIGGNVKENLEDIVRILRAINLLTPVDVKIIPVVPYYSDILALDDGNPLERKRGIENGIALIETGVFDELWLTGEKISLGMKEEIKMFILMGKPVIDYTNKF